MYCKSRTIGTYNKTLILFKSYQYFLYLSLMFNAITRKLNQQFCIFHPIAHLPDKFVDNIDYMLHITIQKNLKNYTTTQIFSQSTSLGYSDLPSTSSKWQKYCMFSSPTTSKVFLYCSAIFNIKTKHVLTFKTCSIIKTFEFLKSSRSHNCHCTSYICNRLMNIFLTVGPIRLTICA